MCGGGGDDDDERWADEFLVFRARVVEGARSTCWVPLAHEMRLGGCDLINAQHKPCRLAPFNSSFYLPRRRTPALHIASHRTAPG